MHGGAGVWGALLFFSRSPDPRGLVVSAMSDSPDDPVRPRSPLPGPGSRFRRLALRLALLVGSTVLCLGAGELVLRLVGLFPPAPRYHVGERTGRSGKNFVEDELVGWRMKPDRTFRWRGEEGDVEYRSNASGCRSPRPFQIAQGERRVAVVGDSHSFGFGMEYSDSFGARFEAEHPGVVVQNFSQPGFGVDQMWLALRHQALPLKPELVIVGIYVNDFERSLTAFRAREGFTKPRYRWSGEQLVPMTAADRPSVLFRALDHHSHVVSAVRSVLRKLSFEWGVGEPWSLNEAILDAIRRDCRDAGANVVFLFIPDRNWRPIASLQQYAEDSSAVLVDLSDSAHRPEYFLDDGHLSAAGHELAARELARCVAELPSIGTDR